MHAMLISRQTKNKIKISKNKYRENNIDVKIEWRKFFFFLYWQIDY